MTDAASYIYKKLKEEHLLTKAFNWDKVSRMIENDQK